MSIVKIPFNEFIQDFKNYYGSKVTFSEYPVFLNTNGVFPDYYLEVGKKGGLRMHYEQSKSLYLSGGVHFSSNYGIMHKNVVILPNMKYLSNLLPSIIKTFQSNLKTYEKTYENAKARLTTIDNLKNDYPELIF